MVLAPFYWLNGVYQGYRYKRLYDAIGASRYSLRWRKYAKRLARSYGALAATGLATGGVLAAMPRFRRDGHGRLLDRFGHQMVMPDGGTYANSSRKRARSESRGGMNPSVMTMNRLATGKWKSFGAKMNSLMKASMVPFIDRFGVLSTTYDQTGSYPLVYKANTGATGFDYPLYLLELNTAPLCAAAPIGAPLMRLQRITATGLYNFTPIAGQNADKSAVQYSYETEYNGDGSVAPPIGGGNFGPYNYMDWADIRIACNGPKKTPSKFTVKLVQFLDDQCMPDCFSTTYSAPTTVPSVQNGRAQPATGTDEGAEWNSFWQEYIANLLGNPLTIRSHPTQRKIRTLKSYSYMFQPRSTIEDSITGGTGDMKLIKWFHRVQRTYTYARVNDPTGVTAAEEIDPTETNNNITAQTDTHARPKARLFVLFQAFTPVIADGTADKAVNDVGCSFDVQVRRKWYMMDHN